MLTFDIEQEAAFDEVRHVETILAEVADGDVSVASWSPGQISPLHCHPEATEIYFCFKGGGTMRTMDRSVAVEPGKFVVHPPGEVHEYVNGPERSILFRVRYGPDMASRHLDNRGKPGWQQKPQDAEYFRSLGLSL